MYTYLHVSARSYTCGASVSPHRLSTQASAPASARSWPHCARASKPGRRQASERRNPFFTQGRGGIAMGRFLKELRGAEEEEEEEEKEEEEQEEEEAV